VQTFYQVLLQYIVRQATRTPAPIDIIAPLARPLFDLTQVGIPSSLVGLAAGEG